MGQDGDTEGQDDESHTMTIKHVIWQLSD